MPNAGAIAFGSLATVIPAEAGTHIPTMDSGFHRNDDYYRNDDCYAKTRYRYRDNTRSSSSNLLKRRGAKSTEEA